MPTHAGLIIATSGTPDESCIFQDGRMFHGISSISAHAKAQISAIPRVMMRLVGSPYFGTEVFTFDRIAERYDFVFVIGSKTQTRSNYIYYKGAPLGHITELYMGMSNHYGVTVEMSVEESIVGIYKERFKMVPWIAFEVVNNVEFTNA